MINTRHIRGPDTSPHLPGSYTYATLPSTARPGKPYLLGNGITVARDGRLAGAPWVPYLYQADDWSVLTELDPASYTPGSPPDGWGEALTFGSTITVASDQIVMTAPYDAVNSPYAQLVYTITVSAGDQIHMVIGWSMYQPQGGYTANYGSVYIMRIDNRRTLEASTYGSRSGRIFIYPNDNTETWRTLDAESHVDRWRMDNTENESAMSDVMRLDVEHPLTGILTGDSWVNGANENSLRFVARTNPAKTAESAIIKIDWCAIFKKAA